MKLINKTSLVLIFLLSLSYAMAAPGNFCITSPCACGSSCQDGGNEVSNGYNTIDSCQDGPEDSYEYVHDINITNLNATNFAGGHTIQIHATVDCDLDGDEISFVYHNSIEWNSFFDVTCSGDGKSHYYQNLTLSDVAGNHSIRVTLAYSGSTNMICAYTYDSVYSDTDDISFYVESSGDNIKPTVKDISPSDQTFFYQNNLSINISVNASDDIAISNVSANISWSTKSELIQLVNFSGLFQGNFTNTSDLSRYDITILAYDTSGNLNDTQTSYFYINATTNITITYPSEGVLYPSKNPSVEYFLTPGSDIYQSWIKINDNNTIHGMNKKISFEDPDNTCEQNYQRNLSQSFYASRDTYVRQISVKLKKNGTGSNFSRIEIRNNSNGNPSNIIRAYAEINNSLITTNYTWINFTLNQTIILTGDLYYWLFLTENGTAQNHYCWQSNLNYYAGGNYSNNASKDLLFKIFDRNRFNLSFTATDSTLYFQAYANTSQGLISSAIVTSYFDKTTPTISEYSYAPTEIFSLDPNVTINISANVSDNLQIDFIYLQHKYQDNSTWTNISMQNISGLYTLNLTLTEESNVTIRILAKDTSHLQILSSNSTLPVFYDWNWTISPAQFNSTGVLLNTNITIGNLSIISNSDYDLTFNLSSLSSRDVKFNNTNKTLTTVPANTNINFIISSQGADTPQENSVVLNVIALNDSAIPSLMQNNFTLISYLTGPYLVVDIIEYDSSVTQGDHVNSIKAKITNVGNETANNLTATWSLPSGWTSRDNLTTNYTLLSSGGFEVWEFEISADIPSNADTGQKTISIQVNSTENVTATDSRTVIVSSASPPSPPGSSGGSSSTTTTTVPAPPIFIMPHDIYTNLSELRIPINENYLIHFVIKNNASNRHYENIDLYLEGIFRSYYNLTPEKISSLTRNEMINAALEFTLPDYYPEGKTELSLIFKTDYTIISKSFSIIAYDKIFSLLSCLNNSQNIIFFLNQAGVNTIQLQLENTNALEEIDNSNYRYVREFCQKIELYYEEYLNQVNDLEKITGRIIDLKSKGYETKNLEEYIKFIKDTLLSGDLEKSNELIGKGNILLESAIVIEKPFKNKILDFINLNKSFLITILVLSPILVLITGKVVSITKTENRIKALQKEKNKILELIKNMQDNFYGKHLIGKDIYDKYIDNYKKRLGEISIAIVKLSFQRKHYFKPTLKHEQLQYQNNEIKKLQKSAQEDYYVKKIIDYDSYEKLESIYHVILSDIKEKLNLKAKTKKVVQSTNHVLKSKKEHKKGALFEKTTNDFFNLNNGDVISSIKQLYEILYAMEDTLFGYHVTKEKNDFATWIKNVFDNNLGKKLSHVKTKNDFMIILEKYFRINENE